MNKIVDSLHLALPSYFLIVVLGIRHTFTEEIIMGETTSGERLQDIGTLVLILLQNIDCGYSLEPHRRGGSNVYPQTMFCAKVYPLEPHFYIEKNGGCRGLPIFLIFAPKLT